MVLEKYKHYLLNIIEEGFDNRIAVVRFTRLMTKEEVITLGFKGGVGIEVKNGDELFFKLEHVISSIKI